MRLPSLSAAAQAPPLVQRTPIRLILPPRLYTTSTACTPSTPHRGPGCGPCPHASRLRRSSAPTCRGPRSRQAARLSSPLSLTAQPLAARGPLAPPATARPSSVSAIAQVRAPRVRRMRARSAPPAPLGGTATVASTSARVCTGCAMTALRGAGGVCHVIAGTQGVIAMTRAPACAAHAGWPVWLGSVWSAIVGLLGPSAMFARQRTMAHRVHGVRARRGWRVVRASRGTGRVATSAVPASGGAGAAPPALATSVLRVTQGVTAPCAAQTASAARAGSVVLANRASTDRDARLARATAFLSVPTESSAVGRVYVTPRRTPRGVRTTARVSTGCVASRRVYVRLAMMGTRALSATSGVHHVCMGPVRLLRWGVPRRPPHPYHNRHPRRRHHRRSQE